MPDPEKPRKPRRPRTPAAPPAPEPSAGVPDPSSPPAELERALGPSGDTRREPDELPELDEKPDELPAVVELDSLDGLDADELPRPEDDRDPDPADLHPFAARFHSRGFARGHVCPSCGRATAPVQPGHTFCARCGAHWTLDAHQA